MGEVVCVAGLLRVSDVSERYKPGSNPASTVFFQLELISVITNIVFVFALFVAPRVAVAPFFSAEAKRHRSSSFLETARQLTKLRQ